MHHPECPVNSPSKSHPDYGYMCKCDQLKIRDLQDANPGEYPQELGAIDYITETSEQDTGK